MTMKCYYLIANKSGFEEPLRAGTEAELTSEKKALERKQRTMQEAGAAKGPWERVSYYLVPKEEWDRQNCPLMPVDLS